MKLKDLAKLDERLKLLARYEATGLTPEAIEALLWTAICADEPAPLPLDLCGEGNIWPSAQA
ncbi:MAG: hypothetical protein GX540_04345 [Clostridiales bacterium]|nr:hypothetical protein [Clostridiales bacterium]